MPTTATSPPPDWSPSATAAPRGDRAPGGLRDYLALTRPRVLTLVLLTGPPAFALDRGGWPEAGTLLGVLAGTALVGGGCGALNAWYERELDARMARTRGRPLPAGRLSPARALAFGLAISLLGLLALALSGSSLSAAIGLAALLHYLFVYTIWLKPRTPYAVVVGGISGAIAPLVVDAADGAIGVWGLVLFAIVFVWQPPHFWAIALHRKADYAAAGFPMLPAVVGETATRRQMLRWALALLPVTLLPWVGGALGPAYALVALATGCGFIAVIRHAQRVASLEADRRVFRVSLVCLSLLFSAMLVELVAR